MANPPVNRRPGVDADIFQGTWVRGYDVPAGDQTLPPPDPCDLIVSGGQSQIDQSVANLVFANRVDDIGQPIFVMAQGDTPTSPLGTVNFHIGREADPNGLITSSTSGSLYASYGTPGLWQLQADNTTWVKISDDLGGEDLAETLAIGNITGGNDIVMTIGDSIVGADNNTGTGGGPVNLRAGNETNALGDGGGVFLQSGGSVGGNTGPLQFTTPTPGGSGNSGSVLIQTGTSLVGGDGGDITLRGGGGAQGGQVVLEGGDGSLAGERGGRVQLIAGNSAADGDGGSVNIAGGSPGTPIAFSNVFNPGEGGTLNFFAGNSAGTETGGWAALVAGEGGSGGGTGGSVFLGAGSGGGGAPDGEIIGNGNFRADNIKRGNGDPNGSVDGNEGDIYQRLDSGNGELWINLNGTINGWSKMGLAGDFIAAFEELNWGYLCRAGANQGGTNDEQISANGSFRGIDVILNGTALIGAGRTAAGPHFALSAPAAGDYAGVDMETNSTSALPYAMDQDIVITFRARNTNQQGLVFMGLSDSTVADHATNPQFPGGNFVGFAMTGGSTWRAVTGNGLFTSNENMFVTTADVAAASEPYFFVINAIDLSAVKFMIFDENLNLLSTRTMNSTIPSSGLGLCMVERNLLGLAGTFLQVASVSLVADADVVGMGAGAGAGSLALNQVLINGNESGANPILMNHASGGILGVTDDNGGAGSDLIVRSGLTTNGAQDSGNLLLFSGARTVGGTGETGAASLFSGSQDAAATGATGLIAVTSGDHAGTGATGDVTISTGLHSGAGGTQGSILLRPGRVTASFATTTGSLDLEGGSSSLLGVTGGEVNVLSGGNSSAQGDTGDVLVQSRDANLDGASGRLELKTGDAGTNAGTSGNIDVETGDGVAGGTGAVAVTTGDAGNGSAGAILVAVGDTSSGVGSNLILSAGDTADAAALGGDITLTPGTGGLGAGAVVVNGKLTVTGPIDPTALGLTGVAANPLSLVGGIDGILWVDNTGPSGQLIYTNSDGDTNISTGGGSTTLAGLTDVTIAAPAPGEVLMLNGALQWVNAVGAGGVPLETVLLTGNTTGNLPIVIEDSLGSRITSDGNLTLDPAVAPGSAVIIDGMLWPEADGLAGYVLTTNGGGQLSWQPGGGGGGSATFAQAFAQMQWGTFQPNEPAAPPVGGAAISGFFNAIAELSVGPGGSFSTADGVVVVYETGGAFTDAFIETPTSKIDPGSRFFSSFKFSTSIAGLYRSFVGLTINASPIQLGVSPAPGAYVGLLLDTGIAPTYQFMTATAGAPTLFDTGVLPGASSAFWLEVDATTPGQITLTLYDAARTSLSTHTFLANLPAIGGPLQHMAGVHNLEPAPTKSVNVWSFTTVTRADLLAGIGGGGNQDLTSVLGFGNATGGLAIQGDDNAGGSGTDLDLFGGTSTGGGGAGGSVNVTAGAPDPGGIGGAGDIVLATSGGAGTGDGGDFRVTLGVGGPGGGDGGAFTMFLGDGAGTGSGGAVLVTAGDSGTGGGAFAGAIGLTTGSGGVGSGATGGRFQVTTGTGDGAGNGGSVLYTTGAGGAGGGDGGSFVITLGTGGGGGSDGELLVNGDAHITGKLTVDGMIDPPGLLMSSSVGVPFTPIGSEGGIWVNGAGELIYTNLGGDLNLSTAVGGGLSFLDGLLISGYGFLGPGNPIAGPLSYGVYGSSILFDTDPSPPPASITFGEDTEGPFNNLALGNVAGSEAFISTADLFIRRDSQFKAVFKFQVTSAAHTTERIFIGFTDEPNPLAVPSVQLSVNDPAGLQYFGLRQDEPGFNLEFVARGSGGAMAPVFAIPTDALVHYLVIDASASTGDVTFSLYDDTFSDPPTATHTEPASFLLPDLANPLRPFVGLNGQATTPRAIDFYFSSIITRADVVDAVVGGGGGGGGNPPLETVLAAGDTTGANGIEFSAGNAGITSEVAAPNTATGGANIALALGAGSTETGTAAGGGSGGSLSFLFGAGGDTDAAAAFGGGGGAWVTTLGSGGDNTGGSNGGSGGSFLIAAGPGGDATAGTGNGGRGGTFAFTAGPGGASTSDTGGNGGDFNIDLSSASGGAGDLQGGRGGRFQVVGGDGGSSASGTAGDGSSITIAAGIGGTGFVANGQSGSVTLEGGLTVDASDNSLNGGVALLGGGATLPFPQTGNINLVGSPWAGAAATSGYLIVDQANSGDGGSIVVVGGDAPVGSAGDGGSIVLQAGPLDPGGDAGHIYIFGDGGTAGTSISPGGDVQLAGATLAGTSEGARLIIDGGSAITGGVATLQGGDALPLSALSGGPIVILAGTGDGALPGGATTVSGGPGGPTGDGGNLNLRGGSSTGAVNTGGDVSLIPGPGVAGQGLVKVEGRFDPAVAAGAGVTPGMQFSFAGSPGVSGVPGIIDPGLLLPGVPPVSFLVPYNAPVGAAPQNVQVTLAQFVPGPLALIQCAVTSITPVDFTIVFDAPPPGGLGFTWVAYL